MHATTGLTRKQVTGHVLDPHLLRGGHRQQRTKTLVGTLRDTHLPGAPGAQRLEHGIDAVDDHPSSRRANALARSATPAMRTNPDVRPDSAAPRSMAGTATSSSRPSCSPVTANLIG